MYMLLDSQIRNFMSKSLVRFSRTPLTTKTNFNCIKMLFSGQKGSGSAIQVHDLQFQRIGAAIQRIQLATLCLKVFISQS